MEKEEYMKLALEEAIIGYKEDEVPVGAIITDENGVVIAKAHNNREKTQNACNHAEILAIQEACNKKNLWRLDDCTLYVTLEPCIMCAGAIINSRIKKVYYGAYDKRVGCISGSMRVFDNKDFNHNPEYEGGILEEECSALLSTYFKNKRN